MGDSVLPVVTSRGLFRAEWTQDLFFTSVLNGFSVCILEVMLRAVWHCVMGDSQVVGGHALLSGHALQVCGARDC